MDRGELYDKMADRKSKPKDFEPYDGNNGRVNKCATLIKQGKLPQGGRLLDVGGGIGDLGDAVKTLFDERHILDISVKNLEAAKAKGNEVILADVDRQGIPCQNNYYNLVTALDFIEHIIDPEKFARECARVLQPGGEVFINTPNIRFFKHILQLWVDGTFPHTSGDTEIFHGGHLAFYTYNDLCTIFGRAGFVGFKQFKDEECYVTPPTEWVQRLNPRNQWDFEKACLELGCPNMLFRAAKP
jgi:cyclopropane fatty-acyl-phospholipid synthase-like methyltransferase